MTSAAFDFSSPLLAPLQVFNLLPSRTLHAERARAFWPEDAEHAPLLQHESVERALHRQRSAELLQSLGEHAQPVDDLAHAELPLALAAPPLLAQLARLSGVMLMGGMLRRTIARDHVAHAKQVLGAEIFHWAQGDAEALHPGLDDAQLRPWLGDDLHASAVALGSGLVANAWHEAPAPIRLRANWKLPAQAETQELRAASGLAPHAARDVCLALMQQLDSTWLSSFPATR